MCKGPTPSKGGVSPQGVPSATTWKTSCLSLALPLRSCAYPGCCLSLLICQMGTIAEPTSQGFCITK